jgi:ABC-type amino acid transport substrate-binding protein
MRRTHFQFVPVRRSAFIVLVAITAPLVLRAQPQAGRPLLEIAVEDEADPWSRRDGSGYANDLVRAAFTAAGVDVTLHVMPYARCKQMAIEGTMPACVSMSANVLRPDPVTFSPAPLFVFASDYFVNRNRALSATQASDLPRGTTVGVVLGYEYPESIYRLSREGVIVLDYSASETINLRKVVAGRLDAAMVNHDELKTVDYALKTAGVAGKVRSVFSAGSLPAFIGFSRKHPQASMAYDRYVRGTAIIATNGTAARIRDNWVSRVNRMHAAEASRAANRVRPL